MQDAAGDGEYKLLIKPVLGTLEWSNLKLRTDAAFLLGSYLCECASDRPKSAFFAEDD